MYKKKEKKKSHDDNATASTASSPSVWLAPLSPLAVSLGSTHLAHRDEQILVRSMSSRLIYVRSPSSVLPNQSRGVRRRVNKNKISSPLPHYIVPSCRPPRLDSR